MPLFVIAALLAADIPSTGDRLFSAVHSTITGWVAGDLGLAAICLVGLGMMGEAIGVPVLRMLGGWSPLKWVAIGICVVAAAPAILGFLIELAGSA